MLTVWYAHRAPVPQPGCRVVLCPLFLRGASSEHPAVFAAPSVTGSVLRAARGGTRHGGGACARPRPPPHQAPPPDGVAGGAGRGRCGAAGRWPRSGELWAVAVPRHWTDRGVFVPRVLWAHISEANPVWRYGAEAGRRVDADIIGLLLLINRAALIHCNK